ncbi:hypothetical protein HK100_005884, partial [Physocladia obscura]
MAERQPRLPQTLPEPSIVSVQPKQIDKVNEVPAVKQSLPYIHPFVKIEMLKERIRLQPQVPMRRRPSMETIMKDMNMALNNLFFYPHSKQTQKVIVHTETENIKQYHKIGEKRHRRKDHFNNQYSSIDNNEGKSNGSKISYFVDKARKEYDFCHLKIQDYAKPFPLCEIEVVQKPAKLHELSQQLGF